MNVAGPAFLSVLSLGIETAKLFLLQTFLGYRIKSKKFFWAVYAAASAVIFCITLPLQKAADQLFEEERQSFIIPAIVIITSTIFILSTEKRKNRIISIIFGETIIAAFDDYAVRIFEPGNGVNLPISRNVAHIGSALVLLLLFIIIYLKFKHKIKENKYLIDFSQLNFITLLLVTLIIFLNFLFLEGMNSNPEKFISVEPVEGTSSFSFNTSAFTLLYFLSSTILLIAALCLLILSAEHKIVKADRSLLKIHKANLQILLQKEEDTKKFRHDIRQHLYGLGQLLANNEIEKLKAYLSDLDVIVQKVKTPYNTGNSVVDAVLYDITQRYQHVKFEIDWQGFLADNMRISDFDLCSIFSNAIVNAIEAIERINPEEPLTISVQITRDSNTLYILIKNPCNEKLSIKNNEIKSSKSNKSLHGYGTRNIKESVEKYGGQVLYSCNDKNEFLVEITFLW